MPTSAIVVVDPYTCQKNQQSVHGALATKIILDVDSYKPWLAMMPSMDELEASMPVLWSKDLQASLPPRAKGMYAPPSFDARQSR